jgi:hypothetical protein
LYVVVAIETGVFMVLRVFRVFKSGVRSITR